jgi:hypothetical protein
VGNTNSTDKRKYILGAYSNQMSSSATSTDKRKYALGGYSKSYTIFSHLNGLEVIFFRTRAPESYHDWLKLDAM